MSSQLTNIVILAIAAAAPVYLMIRVRRWGYLLGVMAVTLLLMLRDSLFAGTCRGADVCVIWFFSRFLAGLSYCTPLYCLKTLFALFKNRKKHTPAPPATKIRFAVPAIAVALIVPAWWFWLGLIQCYLYNEVTANLSNATRLSVKPQRIELSTREDSHRFSLGYAEVAIPPEAISSVKIAFKTSILIDYPEWDVAFIRPFDLKDNQSRTAIENINPLPVDFGLWKHDNGSEGLSADVLKSDPVGSLLLLMREDPFACRLEIENALPKTYKQIFLMKHDKYRRHILSLMSKAVGPVCEGGILVFETPYIQGFVFLGRGREGREAFAEVFSRDRNISQGINVGSDSQEKSTEIQLSLLASYRYTISSVPPEDELHHMITAEIAKHDKFEDSEPQE